MTVSAPARTELRWVHPVDGERTFVLQSEGSEIGRLLFEEDPGAGSTAWFDGRRWSFTRTGAFRQLITIRAGSSGPPVAEFTPFLGAAAGASFSPAARSSGGPRRTSGARTGASAPRPTSRRSA